MTRHPDGYGGARDAAILADYGPAEANVVRVQATRRSLRLLRRAGHRRLILAETYPVLVTRDRFNRLQLDTTTHAPAY